MAKCYLGELLHGEMLYGEMLYVEMLYGEMLYGEMLLSHYFDPKQMFISLSYTVVFKNIFFWFIFYVSPPLVKVLLCTWTTEVIMN